MHDFLRILMLLVRMGMTEASAEMCAPQYAEPTLADAVRPSVRRSKDHDRPHTRNRDGIAHCTTSTYGRHVRMDYGVQRATSAACLLELQRNMGKIGDHMRSRVCWKGNISCRMCSNFKFGLVCYRLKPALDTI